MLNEQEKKTLEGIYAEIPSLGDCAGCNDCCGPIKWLDIEDENIRQYLREHGIPFREKPLPPVEILRQMCDREVNEVVTCPYSRGGKCEIYPVRPLMCRLFGVISDYPMYHCPKMTPEKTITKKVSIELWRRVAEMR